MRLINVKCPGRVCLFLNFFKDKNGNKDFKMVNDTVNIYDEFEIIVDSHAYNSNRLSSYNSEIPHNDNNLLFKAANAFFKYIDYKNGHIYVNLKKNIPVNCGMGGSSSDAAGVILALNDYFELNLTKEELITIARTVGEDVPYFLFGGYRIVTNNGEIIDDLGYKEDNYYLMVIPKYKIDPKELYNVAPKIDNGEVKFNRMTLYNDIEQLTREELLRLKGILLDNGAIRAGVNGVSDTLVGSYTNEHLRYLGLSKMSKEYVKTRVCRSSEGITLMRRYI